MNETSFSSWRWLQYLARWGADVESADEPDVLFTHNNASWDVACKLIYSKNPVTLCNRVEEGIAQVRRFDSDYGLVSVGVTNRVDHKKFMPLLGEPGAQVGESSEMVATPSKPCTSRWKKRTRLL